MKNGHGAAPFAPSAASPRQRASPGPAEARAAIAPRIVMAGPLPPVIGGMASVVRDLSESRLGDAFTVERFDTAKQTPVGRSPWAAIAARVRLWRRWWRALGGGTPTIAHIHSCSGLSFFLDGVLLLIARLRRVPVVLHIHGGAFDTFIDRLDPVRRSLARAFARRAERVIVLSGRWRERLAPRLPGARLQVIENGVPSAGLEAPAAVSGVPLILFVGALCRAKGVEDLVRASARLTVPARLVLVGPEAEPGFVAHLRVLAEQLGVGSRTEFPGAAEPATVREWLAQAALFALPSHVEGMPIVLLEAMSAGLPVVATRVGAVPAVVEPERSGLLVDTGDVDALASAIGRLLADERLREAFGRNGRAIWAERFSIDRAAAELGRLYADVLAARERR